MSLLLVCPCRNARLTPGQPASSCNTFCPGGTVRAAVAVQSLPAVSVCARAAPAEQTSAATDSSRTPDNPRLRIFATSADALPQDDCPCFSVEHGTLGPATSMRNPVRRTPRDGRTTLDLPQPLSRVPDLCMSSRETSAVPRPCPLPPPATSPALPPAPASAGSRRAPSEARPFPAHPAPPAACS